MPRRRTIVLICVMSLVLNGLTITCGAPAVTPGRAPAPVGPASPSYDSAYVRVDSVTVESDVSDLDGRGEFFFCMLATRQSGESAKLVFPGNGTYPIRPGTNISLNRFFLGIDNLQPEERVAIYFLGFDEDAQTTWDEEITDLALDGGLMILEAGMSELLGKFPGGGFVSYIIHKASGEILEWWREADVLGEYAFVMDGTTPSGERQVQSTNGNLKIRFTIWFEDSDRERGAEVPATFPREEIENLLARWDRIHHQVDREWDTSDLDTVLRGDALRQQRKAAASLRSNNCYWIIQDVEPARITYFEVIRPDSMIVEVHKNWDMDLYCDGAKSGDDDGPFTMRYNIDQIDGNWYITRKRVIGTD